MNILSELKKADPGLESLKNYKKMHQCYQTTDILGDGSKCTAIVKILNSGKSACVMVNVGSFDESLCDVILDFLGTIEIEELCFGFPIRVFNGIKSDKFNSVAILNHDGYRRFSSADNSDLDQAVYEFFPVMHYEFSGNETSDELFSDLTRFNQTDWNRKIEPCIKLSYKMQSRSSKKFLKSYMYDLFEILKHLTEEPKYYLKVQNYLDEVCSITKNKNTYNISIEKKKVSIDSKKLKLWLEDYLYKGSGE